MVGGDWVVLRAAAWRTDPPWHDTSRSRLVRPVTACGRTVAPAQVVDRESARYDALIEADRQCRRFQQNRCVTSLV